MQQQATSGENKRKHLEMIQGVINRMASNSFLFKGWSITIIAGISAFAAKDTNLNLMIIPIAATMLFWGVDAYYLMLERAFRKLYEGVAAKDEADIDFAMRPNKQLSGLRSWISTLFSRPVLTFFYIAVFVMLVVLDLVMNKISIEVILRHGT
jgi:hypothetical protein